MSASDPNHAARHRQDVRWRAITLTVILVVLGGLLIESWGKWPSLAKLQGASHAAQKRKSEVDLRFQQGVAMLHAKQYDHALTAFHRVLQLAPEMPEAHVNTGYALLGLKNYGAAKDFFEVATDLRPNQLNAYYGLAEALQALGDNLGALQAMETYVHLAAEDDPFRRKAQSAAWELRAKMEEDKAKAQAQAKTPTSRGKP